MAIANVLMKMNNLESDFALFKKNISTSENGGLSTYQDNTALNALSDRLTALENKPLPVLPAQDNSVISALSDRLTVLENKPEPVLPVQDNSLSDRLTVLENKPEPVLPAQDNSALDALSERLTALENKPQPVQDDSALTSILARLELIESSLAKLENKED
jgi:macrodomain Ter protein organizer (MatP/YcbG family)